MDTNILAYHLGGYKPATKALEHTVVPISFVTEIELQSKPGLSRSDLLSILSALANYQVSDINHVIKFLSAQLRREHGLKLADAIIAATAMHLNVPLLTADNGFQRLGKLLEIRML